MANVGKNIRTMRNKNKMTQDELANKLFVSRQTVSNYETGKSNPDIDMLVKIAEALNTDVNILIFGIPTPPDRKREYQRLGIGVSITVLLGLFILITNSPLEKWTQESFHVGLKTIQRMLVYPLFLFGTGWCIMQFLGTFLNAKPLAGRVSVIIRYLTLLLPVLYAVILLPYCIQEIQCTIWILKHPDTGYSFSFPPDQADGIWWRLEWKLFYFLYVFCFMYPQAFSFLFFFLGAACWGTTPRKPVRKKEPLPNPDTPQ